MPLPSFLQRFRRKSSSGQGASDAVPLTPSDVEATRARARRRLVGMVVLVGAGVIGFPWLFETQPRPLTGDVQVLSANTTAPVVVPVPRTAVTGRVQTVSSVEAEMVEAPEPSPSPDTAA